MGRPKDKRERQIERAQGELRKAVTRRDGGEAAEHLLILPQDQRGDLLPQVTPLFVLEVRRAYQARDVGRLLRWSARLENEPRLAGGEGAEVLFMLSLAALRAREWLRAQRLLAGLTPQLRASAPRLAAWLEAVANHGGALPAEVMAKLPPLPAATEPARDPRLGYDAKPAAPRPPIPQQQEAVPAAVEALFAAERSVARLRDTLGAWARATPEAWRPALMLAAAPFLLRAALRLRAEGHNSSVPLLALVDLASKVPAAVPGVEAEVALALRLCAAELSADPEAIPTKEMTRLLLAVSSLAADYAALRPQVTDLLQRLRIPQEACGDALPLFKQLLGFGAETLALKALRAWVFDEKTEGLPAWLLQALAARIADGSVLTELARADAKYQHETFCMMADFLPVAQCAELLALPREGLDEGVQHELGVLLMNAVERASLEAARASRTPLNPATMTYRDLRRLLDQAIDVPLDLLAIVNERRPNTKLPLELWPVVTMAEMNAKPPEVAQGLGRELLLRFGPSLLPYSLGLLTKLLAVAGSLTKQRAVIDSYLATQGASIDGYLDVVAQLHCPRCQPVLFLEVLDKTLTVFKGDLGALARGLLRADSGHFDHQALRALSIALYDAAAESTAAPTEEVQKALQLAERYAPRIIWNKRAKAKKAAPAKKASAKKAPVKKAAATSEPAPPKRAKAKKAVPAKAAAAVEAPKEPAPAPRPRGRPRKLPLVNIDGQAELPGVKS